MAVDIQIGAPGGYDRIHYRARKALAGSACERCGTTKRIDAALRPDTDPERLRIESATGCRYSISVADYQPLCHACHFQMDLVENRGKCVNGHEFSPENTSFRSNGTRRCKACHREQERARKADPKVRVRVNIRQRELWHLPTPEQHARRMEMQRLRRAQAKAADAARSARFGTHEPGETAA